MSFEVRFLRDKFAQAEAVHALHQQADRPVGGAQQTVDNGDRANLI